MFQSQFSGPFGHAFARGRQEQEERGERVTPLLASSPA